MQGGRECVDVSTFGEGLAVFLADPGTPLAAAGSFRRSVAGAELNLAVGLARLGHRVSWSGRLGDDGHGRLIHRTLRAEGIDTDGVIVDAEAPTGLMVRDVLVSRSVEVAYYRSGSAGSRLQPDDLDLPGIRRSRVLAVSGVTAALSESAFEATLLAVQVARDAGVTVVLDPNLRVKLAPWHVQVPGLRRLCAYADIVLSGEDEALAVSGLDTPGAPVADWFLGQGCRTVVIKQGAQGAWATDGTQTVEQDAYPVAAVDPVGAGDSFAAGFISATLHGCTLAESLQRAAACGALNVAVVGDFDGSPTENELLLFLAGGRDVLR